MSKTLTDIDGEPLACARQTLRTPRKGISMSVSSSGGEQP
jgi:hypothetical protein